MSNDFEIKIWIFLISITLQWNPNRLFFSLVFHSFVNIWNSQSLYNGDIFLVAELLTPKLCYRFFNEKFQIIGNLTSKLKLIVRRESGVNIIVITSANLNFQVTQIWNVIYWILLLGKMYIKRTFIDTWWMYPSLGLSTCSAMLNAFSFVF